MLKLIHAADLHLDSPFAGLRPERAAQRRREQRKLLERLAALAAEKQADLVLLAGDLLDGGTVYQETAAALAAALGAMHCPVLIAPGNHDPLTRDSVYRKSRWQSTKDATDFICWLLDYTGRDVVYSEGEFTGWAAKFSKISQIPKNMDTETDPRKIRDNYANCDMYEVYASYTSMTALLCSAEMAEAMGDTALAEKYRAYAERIRGGMLRMLAVGPDHDRMWRVARNSVLPSL